MQAIYPTIVIFECAANCRQRLLRRPGDRFRPLWTKEISVEQGDLWYFPAGVSHSIQGLVIDGCEFLLVFDDGALSEETTFLLTDGLARTPPDKQRPLTGP
jgi:hypothetical protein